MAKKRVIRKKSIQKEEVSFASIMQTAKRKQTAVGLIVVGLILLSAAILFRSTVQTPNTVVTKDIGKYGASIVVSPSGVIVTPATGSAVLTNGKSATSSATVKVTRLANTSGELKLTVLTHDNFWEISKRGCGTGRYYLSIQAYNGYNQYRSLQPGEEITVICSY